MHKRILGKVQQADAIYDFTMGFFDSYRKLQKGSATSTAESDAANNGQISGSSLAGTRTSEPDIKKEVAHGHVSRQA